MRIVEIIGITWNWSGLHVMYKYGLIGYNGQCHKNTLISHYSFNL